MNTTSQEIDQKQAVTALRRKDLLGIAELSPEEISEGLRYTRPPT